VVAHFSSSFSRKELGGKMQSGQQRGLLSTQAKLASAGLGLAAAALDSCSALGLLLGVPTCCAAVFAMAGLAWPDQNLPPKIAKVHRGSVLPMVAGLYGIKEALQNAVLPGLGFMGLRALA
jgi:arsenical pump membrane protein